MKISGGCYCGFLRYESIGDVEASIQCHCRECQYITGGNPNVIMIMPLSGFKFVKGIPKTFKRKDIEKAVTRLFCENCGTGIGTKNPNRPLIRDLIVEGLSLARTQKEEFNSIIQNNDGDINALFKTLEEFLIK